MQFDRYAKQDPRLMGLLQTARYWQRLDTEVKKLLPANLHPHLSVACIEEGALILHVSGPMAATRLNMLLPTLLPALQELDDRIAVIRTRVRPPEPEAVREKNFRIDEQSLAAFERTADTLPHHPELAEAIRTLVRNQRKP